jgi:signal transduction histidine kinase
MWKSEVFGARPFRLALLFALAISAATVAGFALIYIQVSHEDFARVGAILAQEARRNFDAPVERLRAALDARQTPDIRRIDYLALYDAQGRLVLGNVPRLPPIVIDGRSHFVAGKKGSDVSEDAVFVALRRTDGGLALLGRNLQDTKNIENSLRRALALALAPTVAAILAIGAVFARRGMRRLESVHNAITLIMEGDFGSRLPVSRDRDEIDRVASAVNLMLDEIARLLDQLKSVGDNIAHDLRAPLTLAKIKLEHALDMETLAARAPIEDALAQLERAAVIITALLRISHIENGPRQRHFGDVDLASVCAQASEFYAPLAEAKGLRFTVEAPTPVWIRGDEDLLREAVSNLIDNAIKFTPAGGQVRILAVDGPPRVEVRDNGRGVAPAEREAIFRRFHRAAGSEGEAGNGLGLSIARTIAELHGFELLVEDNAPGAAFVMRAAGKAELARDAQSPHAHASGTNII